MQRRGLTWHAVCSSSSLSRTTLKNILDGADCRASTWERLAKALEVAPAWLMFGYQVQGHEVGPNTVLTVTVDPFVCGDGNLQRLVAELERGFPQTRLILLTDGVQVSAQAIAP